MAVNRVDRARRCAGMNSADRAVCLCGGEFVLAVCHLDVGHAGPDRRSTRLRPAGPWSRRGPAAIRARRRRPPTSFIATHVARPSTSAWLKRDLLGIGDASGRAAPRRLRCRRAARRARRRPRAGCGSAGPDRCKASPARPNSRPRRSASTISSAVKPEAVQVFDQRGTFARVGDACGFQRIEIDHPPESASGVAAIRVESRERNPARPARRTAPSARRQLRRILRLADAGRYAGTVGEHTATREAVGLFDVSHLGKASVRGPGAAEYVNSALTNDLGRIGPGKAQYTLCCTESGGVIDDLIAYYVSDDEVFLVPNAANTAAVVAALRRGAKRADHHRRAPVTRGARRAGTEIGGGRRIARAADRYGLHGLRRRRLQRRRGAGVPDRIHRRARLRAAAAWDDAASGVRRARRRRVGGAGGQLAGLGARDTLRTEMGYPLHGHELSLDISPLQARCGWAIGWSKDAFWGRDALLAEKEAGPKRLLRGLRAVGQGSAAARHDGARRRPLRSG